MRGYPWGGKMFCRRRAQSSLEYALLIVAAVAALIAVQVYMKRGIQGRLRASSDQIGSHFEPRGEYTKKDTIEGHTITEEHYPEDTGGVMTTTSTNESNSRYEYEFWIGD